jgi:hypothetical protein
MQKQESGKSNLKSPDLRVKRANSMSRKYRNSLIALWLIATAMLPSASAQVARNDKPEPLMIQEQGSFAVGGKVTTNSGTFNPRQPTPDGQTLHGDHAYIFCRFQ